MKYLLIVLVLICAENTFAQSKKKQIELLQHQLDSVTLVNAELQERYSSTAIDLHALALETELLRKIAIGYVHVIDTLNQMNLKLEQELEESRDLKIQGQTSDEINKDDFITKNCFPSSSSNTGKAKSKLSDLYEVAHIDYLVSRIQRIFVVISKENVEQADRIKSIVCELKENYSLDDKSNISFFTEKKYANYKTVIFETTGGTVSEETLKEYQDWKDHYYLGEFEFKTRVYSIFPSSDISEKKEHYLLFKCN